MPPSAQPVIEVVAMPQRSEIRSKSSTAMRRKLQNRLNQRAARELMRNPIGFSALLMQSRREAPTSDKLVSQGICIHPLQRHFLTQAPDFQSYMPTPLPADQKLLTLLHFNLVRALLRNVYLLGLNPDLMDDDILSPFLDTSGTTPDLQKLPPTLQPTHLQKTVPHHPEIDCFPFPRYRDNFLRAGTTIDETELCFDVLFGVEIDVHGNQVPRPPSQNCNDMGVGCGGRTGLIVWSDPWLQSSWEVEQDFASKYKGLLKGCDALIKSSNLWRQQRGEEPLVLD
ncbi:hypothetical protein D0Z07_4458 [Hyphodiscus hymeniophilus]|uniref:Uncharacterized protein n=1 Tax=Hyphodiscus hymeniophilus TaxID=353542 RepID=A0A9P6VKW3_9HELO|nr:hypothetical protein D0Z07_4458 [Hyphodiscus hymeniophilus]